VTDSEKVSSDLAAVLDSSGTDDTVDVVIELEPDEAPASTGSRAERIAAARAAFAAAADPVESAVVGAGGEVLDRAWINKTLLARVAAGSLERLSALRAVRAVDVPRKLRLQADPSADRD